MFWLVNDGTGSPTFGAEPAPDPVVPDPSLVPKLVNRKMPTIDGEHDADDKEDLARLAHLDLARPLPRASFADGAPFRTAAPRQSSHNHRQTRQWMCTWAEINTSPAIATNSTVRYVME